MLKIDRELYERRVNGYFARKVLTKEHAIVADKVLGISEKYGCRPSLSSVRAFARVELEDRAKSVDLDIAMAMFNSYGSEQAARSFYVVAEAFKSLHPDAPLWTHAEQEEVKAAARKVIEDKSMPLIKRTEAAIDVMRAYFAESVRWGLDRRCMPLGFVWHPGVDEYAAHWLHSSLPLWKSEFGDDVVQVLAARYPKPTRVLMDPSQPYWPLPKEESL